MDKFVPRNREFSSEETQMIDAMVDMFGKEKEPTVGIESPHDWRRLMESFVNAAKSVDLKDYVSKPTSFPSQEFSVVSDISTFFRMFFHQTMRGIIAEAPFVYAVQRELNSNPWAINLGLIAFRLDMEHKLVLIEQIQGGDTKGTTPAMYEARKLFRHATPEYALYDAVRQFSLSINFRGIGIRKPTSSHNIELRLRAEIGKSTLYQSVAAYAKHDEASPLAVNEFKNYTFEPLLTRAQIKYD